MTSDKFTLPDPKDYVQFDRARMEQELAQAARAKEQQASIKAGDIPVPALVVPEVKVPALGPYHLAIGDPHTKPGVSNQRFEWLGRFIEDRQPDVVVAGGDWFDMPSLCYYDKGKVMLEGQRYWMDIDAGIDALLRLRAQLSPETLELTDFHFLLGNHEYRAIREIENNAQLIGVLDPVRDFMAADLGWTVHGFLEPVELDGITYQHYPDKGGRAPGIGTKHLAANGLAHMHRSCVFFHTHRLDYFAEPQGDHHICCAYAGCYFEHWEDWAGSDNLRWQRGLLELRNIHDGMFAPSWISMDEVKYGYGREKA